MLLCRSITLLQLMYSQDVRFIGRGLKYLSAVSVLPLLYHMQATYELNRVAPLVKYPPVLTLPLGKIHPFAIYHFTLQQPLNKTCNFKTIFRFGHKLFSYNFGHNVFQTIVFLNHSPEP